MVQIGDTAARFSARGFDGDGYRSLAEMRIRVDGIPGDDDMPGSIEFRTTPDGDDSLVTRMSIRNTGNVGIGTTNPQSELQVNGYTQLGLTSGAPPAGDCDEATERGRMKVDNAAGLLYICVDSGWVSK